MALFGSVKLRAPRSDGLSSQEEFDKLIAVERGLEVASKGKEGAIYAGRCTAAGDRNFYAADAKALLVSTERAMAEYPSFADLSDRRDDWAWSVYGDIPIQVRAILGLCRYARRCGRTSGPTG